MRPRLKGDVYIINMRSSGAGLKRERAVEKLDG
jgi:hypothetical protein